VASPFIAKLMQKPVDSGFIATPQQPGKKRALAIASTPGSELVEGLAW